jgi:Zn finger protein HypA/HybF involved in hydrogenase expression
MSATPLYKTLEQELNALLRGVSYECLACGEFVLRGGRTVSCPECGSHLRDVGERAGARVQFDVQAG